MTRDMALRNFWSSGSTVDARSVLQNGELVA